MNDAQTPDTDRTPQAITIDPILPSDMAIRAEQTGVRRASMDALTVFVLSVQDALKKRGPSGVGMFGSGQWTIWEGYAANKLFKAGFRSNNIDPNARHCMASAVMGFMRSFGMDEPMGCYDDFEVTDAFVLWGSNMRLSAPHWRRCTRSCGAG